MKNIKKYKVTYQNEVGLHTEQQTIVLFAPNAEQAKRTAWIRLNLREFKTPCRITDDWATVKEA